MTIGTFREWLREGEENSHKRIGSPTSWNKRRKELQSMSMKDISLVLKGLNIEENKSLVKNDYIEMIIDSEFSKK